MERCELCGRENVVTFHHLIPRCTHKNKWFKKNFTKEKMNTGVYLCRRDCHKEIHKQIPNKELGKNYNTIDKLLSNDVIKKYVDWVKTR